MYGARWALGLLWALALSACTVVLPPDPISDMGLPDTGVPDQGPGTGPDCRIDQLDCPAGEVCDLVTGACGPGVACDPSEPNACAGCPRQGCGHGFALAAWCDPDHGSVCVRVRSACEPCDGDGACGPHPASPLGSACVPYGSTTFCAPPCRFDDDCAQNFGFRCVRHPEDVNRRVCMRTQPCEQLRLELCPANAEGDAQLRYGSACRQAGFCATNQNPTYLGLCLGSCERDADCKADGGEEKICNRLRGVCQTPCRAFQCAGANDPPQVCHEDGLCGRPCDEAEDPAAFCVERAGSNFHCNEARSRPPPYEYAVAYEVGACVRTCGPSACPKGHVCEPATDSEPARCIQGCRGEGDCYDGDRCVEGTPDEEISREECATRPEVEPDAPSLGVCCVAGAP